MNFALHRFLHPFLLPNGLVCLIAIVGLAQSRLPAEVQSFFRIFPVAVVIIGLLLGWRFNRTRLISAILLLLLLDLGLSALSGGLQMESGLQFGSLLLPLNLLLVSWFKERGLLNFRTGFWLMLVVVEVVAVGWLLQEHLDVSRWYLNYPFFELPPWPLPFSPAQFLVNLLVLLLFAWRCVRKAAAFETSFFWAQIVLLAGFSGFGAQPLRLYLASAGLILILGIMESSHSLAYRDELTGLPGRRALNEALAKLGNRYTLAMLDIDHFKKFNDTHGHDVGDQVLKMVAGKLATVSGGGRVFRYGGEEFAVIFPRKSVPQARPYLEALRLRVADARFITRGKNRPSKRPKKKPARRQKSQAALRITISIGVAERGNDVSTPDAVLKAADQALYRAKKTGRNCTCG